MPIRNFLKKINCRNTPLIPHVSKLTKFIFLLTIFAFSFFFIKKTLAALTDQSAIEFRAKQAAITIGNNQEAWMDSALISNSMSFVQILGGSIPDAVLEGKASWVPGGMLGISRKAAVALYTPPASGIEYIAKTFNTFLGKPAYAQGIGFNGLNGILSIWQAFRNATYVLFSVFFVIIGIMIMLRVKISPQAVITIQNSIPKIITTLILITFSYAIAGLLIDFSYLILGIVLTIMQTGAPKLVPPIDVATAVSKPDIFALLFQLIPFDMISALSGVPGLLIGLFGGSPDVAAAFNTILSFGTSLGTTAFFTLVILLFILIFTIKFIFGLAKCYINLILRIIIGPLEIAMGAIPNMKMGFSSWLINVIANLAVFPITVIFLIFLRVITYAVSGGPLTYLSGIQVNAAELWTPPALSFLNSFQGGLLSLIIGMSGMVLVSKLPTLIPEFIFQIKPSPFGKAIGESYTAIGAFPGKVFNAGANASKNITEYRNLRRGTGQGTRANTAGAGGEVSNTTIPNNRTDKYEPPQTEGDASEFD